MNINYMFNLCLSILFAFGLSTVSWAKDPVKTYSMFFDDGGEHPVASCEQRQKLPKKLKKLNSIKKILKDNSHYLGSVQTEFAAKNEAAIDAYEHYFKDNKNCLQTLKILEKQYNQ